MYPSGLRALNCFVFLFSVLCHTNFIFPILIDPITKNGDKPSLLLKDLPVEMIHNVCGKLDHSQKGISNWQQVGEQFGITKQLHGGAWKELMTAGKSPTEVLLEYLQTALPQLTVAEFVQTLQAMERFDVVEILKPYTQGLW